MVPPRRAQAFEGGPPEPAGEPLERAGNGPPRWMVAERDRREAPGNRTRLTDQLVHPGRELQTRYRCTADILEGR